MDEIFRARLLEEWNIYAAHFYHNGGWWVRCSAQIWNEVCNIDIVYSKFEPLTTWQISDFEVLGRALVPICGEIRERFGAAANSATGAIARPAKL